MEVKNLPVDRIKIGENSRLLFSKEDLSELMGSIKKIGLLEPIGVFKSGRSYEVAYGNRRLAAIKNLGQAEISCIIVNKDKMDMKDVMNLAENLQRKNITPLEAGRWIDLIMKRKGLSRKEVSVLVGRPVSYIDCCLSVYRDVPEKYRFNITEGKRSKENQLAISTAHKIVSAARSAKMSRKAIEKCFDMAMEIKPQEREIKHMVNSVRLKKKLVKKEEIRTINLKIIGNKDEIDVLKRKHVDTGKYSSVSALVAAILRGESHVKIKSANF